MSRPVSTPRSAAAIAEAAMPLFARNGFAGTTTREIARAAGVSEALVFQHFPSKAALYQNIVQRGCEGDPRSRRSPRSSPRPRRSFAWCSCLLDHFVGAIAPARTRALRSSTG